jgi:uroporphyrinogen-III decarboxylase
LALPALLAQYSGMTDRLADFDFARHNAEVKQLWASWEKGEPFRTPIILGLATRFFMMHPEANARGYTFRRYTDDPNVMFDAQLAFQRWSKFNLLQDYELGLPEKWQLWVDFQNYYEAAWFGCPVEYIGDQVPDTRPAFSDAPERMMERGMPEPFGGIMGRAREYVDTFRERAKKEMFMGRPIEITAASGIGTDGPMTVACNLFGPDVVCEMMAGDPDRLHRLFEFITEATIRRMKAVRELFKVPVPQDGFGFADDSIALISTPMYREHVLPYHRKLCDTFGTAKPRSIHLCGDATRHFKTLRDELNIWLFDTGFPVDFTWLRKELGPKARIHGGPHIEFLRTATPQQVREETRRILQSGILEGGLFILREGNNLAPGTPVENTEAMYRAGREFGRRESA